MSEANSPYYAAGVKDATADAATVAQCPPGTPTGPDPERSWSVMYMRGYGSVPLVWHVHGPGCKRQEVNRI